MKDQGNESSARATIYGKSAGLKTARTTLGPGLCRLFGDDRLSHGSYIDCREKAEATNPYPSGGEFQSQPSLQPVSRGRSIASLVLGLCSLFLWLCPLVGMAGCIVGLVLGIKGRKRGEGGMAVAGIVLCAIGLLASLLNAGYGAYLGTTGQHPLVNMPQDG